MEITIGKIRIKVGKKTIELTTAEAKELQATLNTHFSFLPTIDTVPSPMWDLTVTGTD